MVGAGAGWWHVGWCCSLFAVSRLTVRLYVNDAILFAKDLKDIDDILIFLQADFNFTDERGFNALLGLLLEKIKTID